MKVYERKKEREREGRDRVREREREMEREEEYICNSFYPMTNKMAIFLSENHLCTKPYHLKCLYYM